MNDAPAAIAPKTYAIWLVLLAADLLAMAPGADGRSRLVAITDAGRDKRQEAHRRWRVAQEGMNAALGNRRVVALHAMIDECLDLLAPAGDEETPV